MKVFHHNDLDGRCAAAIAYQHRPEAEYIEINYNQAFPIETIEKNESVYILDYSIEPHEMHVLLRRTDSVVWIDHHKTAIAKYEDYPEPIAGRRHTDHSGAWLTWEWFHPDAEPPEVVRLVDDWDMWTHEKSRDGQRTRKFVAGMKAYDTDPTLEGGIWEPLLRLNSDESSIACVISGGAAILMYEARQSAEYLDSFGHAVLFEGLNCCACNRGLTNSKLFDSEDANEVPFDIFMPFVWDGFQWTVSLYSKTVDVAEIAKKYGGGGHTNAAGFVCDALPWKVSKI